MKVRDLFENNSREANIGAAQKKLEDLLADLCSYIEDNLTSHVIDLGVARPGHNSVAFKDEAGDIGVLEVHGSFNISNYVVGDFLSPTAEGSLSLVCPLNKELHAKLKNIISRFFKKEEIHLTWSQMQPWHGKDRLTDTAKFELATFEKVPHQKGPSSGSGKYNPRDSFMSRSGEVARQRRVSGSAYSDTFGGDSSNYRR